jgi:hypothetical protein
MSCECDTDLERDQNAAVNLFGYGEQWRDLLPLQAKRAGRGHSGTRLGRLRWPSVNCEFCNSVTPMLHT